jgi:hypothetical protein
MLQPETAFQYSKAEALAVDALFRCIAERGRKLRTQQQATNMQSLDGDTLTGEPEESDTLQITGDDKKPDVARIGGQI